MARKPAKAAKTPTAPVKRNGVGRKEPIRWTLKRAAIECGLQVTQLQTKRLAADIHPGEDHKFSTRQILAMIFGDKAQADTRRAEAEAQAAIRRNLRQDGELIPTAVAIALVDPIMVIIRQKICASSLTDSEKDDMLADLERAKELDWGKAAKNAAK